MRDTETEIMVVAEKDRTETHYGPGVWDEAPADLNGWIQRGMPDREVFDA